MSEYLLHLPMLVDQLLQSLSHTGDFNEAAQPTFKKHKDVCTKNSEAVILNQNDDVESTVDNRIGLLDNIVNKTMDLLQKH